MTWPVLLLARELDIGGSERQLTEIAKALDRSRFTPHVGCFFPQGMRGAELAAAGIPVVSFPMDSFASRAAIAGAWKLRNYVRREAIRLVHAFDYPLTLFSVPVTRWLTDAVVLSSQRSHRELLPRRYRPAIRATDRMARAIVVNCEFVERHLQVDEGIDGSRIRLCYNGVDLERFRPARPDRAGLTVGVVCALRPEKDLGTLIQAFAQVRRPEWKLLIAGDGSERGALREHAAALGLAPDGCFAPARGDTAEYLRSIDIFVLPSRSEAFSNSLLEAMACGCCPVASRVGGNPELVRHGDNGMLFEAGNVGQLCRALEELAGNNALRRRLAARARCTAERFSIAASAQRMGEIYAEYIEARASRR